MAKYSESTVYENIGKQVFSQNNSVARTVILASRGDIDSFGRLYNHYYGSMASLAYSMLGDRHQAEDIAQETFVVAGRQLDRLRKPDKFGQWLAGICRNIARQALRDKKRLKITNNLPEAATSECIDSHSYDKDEVNLKVKNAIMNLPIRDRQVIVMRYYNNMSYEQIAEILDITSQAVNARLIRAKRKLTGKLKNEKF